MEGNTIVKIIWTWGFKAANGQSRELEHGGRGGSVTSYQAQLFFFWSEGTACMSSKREIHYRLLGLC